MKLRELLDEDILDGDCGIRLVTEQGRVVDFENLYLMNSILDGSVVMNSDIERLSPSKDYKIIIKLDWEV